MLDGNHVEYPWAWSRPSGPVSLRLYISTPFIAARRCPIMKIAVIGSRQVSGDVTAQILQELPAGVSEIVSGGAQGVDTERLR